MRGWLVVSLAVAAIVGSGGCEKKLADPAEKEPASAEKSNIPELDWKVELTGPGLAKPTTFTYAQLARREMVLREKVLMQQTHDEDRTDSWRGPALAPLLAEAGLKPGPMTIAFDADDGYSKDMGLEDISDAIIALQDGEGRWLAEVDGESPLRLVPPSMPGDYWIMYLNRITVTPIAQDQPAE